MGKIYKYKWNLNFTKVKKEKRKHKRIDVGRYNAKVPRAKWFQVHLISLSQRGRSQGRPLPTPFLLTFYFFDFLEILFYKTEKGWKISIFKKGNIFIYKPISCYELINTQLLSKSLTVGIELGKSSNKLPQRKWNVKHV